jgi:hypothetical protein
VVSNEVLKKQKKTRSHYSLKVVVHACHHIATVTTAPLLPWLHADPVRATREEENNTTSSNEKSKANRQ